MNYLILITLAVVCWAGRARGETSSQPGPAVSTNPAAEVTARAESETEAWPSNVVARVNDFDVPYAWFLNEFRSTFFQHAGATDVRGKVMKDLLDRMVLYETALRSEVAQDPMLQLEIEHRLASAREFMSYQLDMTRVALLTEAYLKKHPPGDLTEPTEEDVRAFYAKEIAGQPGAPATWEEVPAAFKDRLRQQTKRVRLQTILQGLVEQLKTNAVIRVNEPLMQATPLPQMKGEVPPEVRNLR